MRTCSAEDLIVLNAFADRDKDWSDVRSILQRQQGKLNIDSILDNLKPLCELKEAPEIVTKLNKIIESLK